MRNVIRLQMELGQVAIEEIEIDESSRDDIPPLLLGLRHVYADRSVRARLFEILEQGILPEVSHTKGRPGMELWRILVMGLLKQVLGCDFDRLHELVNQHPTVRKFLGHSGFWDETRYRYPTVVPNVSLLTPDVLGEVLQRIAESGHARVRKRKRKSGPGGRPSEEPLRGRCDSFVVKTDVHFPTDVNLLWDAMRCRVRETGRSALRGGGVRRAAVAASEPEAAAALSEGSADPAGPSGADPGVPRRLLGGGPTGGSDGSCASGARRRSPQDSPDRVVPQACPEAARPSGPPPAERREDPAGREGVFDLRGAHALVCEGQGRGAGGTRSAGGRAGGPARLPPYTPGSCGKAETWILPYPGSGKRRPASPTSACAASIGGSTVPPTGSHWTNCWITTCCRRRENSVRPTGNGPPTRRSGRCAGSIRPWSPPSIISSRAAGTGSGRRGRRVLRGGWRSPWWPSMSTASGCCCRDRPGPKPDDDEDAPPDSGAPPPRPRSSPGAGTEPLALASGFWVGRARMPLRIGRNPLETERPEAPEGGSNPKFRRKGRQNDHFRCGHYVVPARKIPKSRIT